MNKEELQKVVSKEVKPIKDMLSKMANANASIKEDELIKRFQSGEQFLLAEDKAIKIREAYMLIGCTNDTFKDKHRYSEGMRKCLITKDSPLYNGSPLERFSYNMVVKYANKENGFA